jgi:hypothetical protein
MAIKHDKAYSRLIAISIDFAPQPGKQLVALECLGSA